MTASGGGGSRGAGKESASSGNGDRLLLRIMELLDAAVIIWIENGRKKGNCLNTAALHRERDFDYNAPVVVDVATVNSFNIAVSSSVFRLLLSGGFLLSLVV